ncbi:hypothetical protein [Streptomyces sp. CB01580]|uniref:hypothetical protein n=1 Tax=Streptomyces sp. CB01580 TaxID=1703933 RepID=UPI00093FB373|nr:hypothetical protein [Streptomyces sp. CB01580]
MKIRAFRHPLATHAAGTVLGYRRDGRPIYAIAGGDGTGEGGTGGDGGQGNTGDGTETQGGTGGQGDGGQDPAKAQAGTSGEDPAAMIARLTAELSAARAEAGKTRVTAKQQAADAARASLAQDIGKALGLIKDDAAAPDPAQLTQQLAAEQAKARANAIELAAYKAAQTEGANATRLLNSRAFAERLADLDPAADDFTTKLKAAIKAEVDTDPGLYRTGPTGPAKGGADFGGSGPAEKKPATLHDAIAARLGG